MNGKVVCDYNSHMMLQWNLDLSIHAPLVPFLVILLCFLGLRTLSMSVCVCVKEKVRKGWFIHKASLSVGRLDGREHKCFIIMLSCIENSMDYKWIPWSLFIDLHPPSLEYSISKTFYTYPTKKCLHKSRTFSPLRNSLYTRRFIENIYNICKGVLDLTYLEPSS